MNSNALRKLRSKLAADHSVLGFWVTLEAPSLTELAVLLGIDWVVIDAEHGHLDWKEIVEHLRATERSETVALVRVSELNGSLIKRALDLGADGIIVPWVETAEQVREALAWSLYPPQGKRGIGGERATSWGLRLAEHTAEANENVLVIPMIETVRTMPEVPQMCAVDGVEMFLFGPADFSSSVGHRGQWEGPGVAQQILEMKDTIRRAGKHCGVMSTGLDNLRLREQQGFRFLGLGSDMGLLSQALRTLLAAVR